MSMNRLSEYFFEQEIDELATATSTSREDVRETLLAQIKNSAFEQLKVKINNYVRAVKKRLRKRMKPATKILVKQQLQNLEVVFLKIEKDHEISHVNGLTKAEVEQFSKERIEYVQQVINELGQDFLRMTRAKPSEPKDNKHN